MPYEQTSQSPLIGSMLPREDKGVCVFSKNESQSPLIGSNKTRLGALGYRPEK